MGKDGLLSKLWIAVYSSPSELVEFSKPVAGLLGEFSMAKPNTVAGRAKRQDEIEQWFLGCLRPPSSGLIRTTRPLSTIRGQKDLNETPFD